MKKTLLFAVAVGGILSLTASANAGEPLMSPRAKELAYSLRKVPSAPSTVNLATNRPVGNAKAWELARSFRKAPSAGPGIDLAHAPRPTMSPKDPRYEAALRANAAREFQIAPVK
ncbi:MAG: hypothetical protein KIS67_25550 [Verrucomicrobiae bacterium]|nr:hypothetical protein [Verrucomicrobiae bacterium]